MATVNYMTGRKKYGRPQAVLFADNPGTMQVNPDTGDIYYIPNGYEINAAANNSQGALQSDINQFIILSDDNRAPIDFSTTRIERRERMINGRMRSYHIADKLSISMSWDMLPSRSFTASPDFNSNGVAATTRTNIRNVTSKNVSYTSDRGAGGIEILDWYEKHPDSFWVYLSYDKYTNFGDGVNKYDQLQKYSQVVEVFFTDFSYSVQKRGATNHDFWSISLSLEEV